MRNDFCVFILSYKRANNMYTVNTLLQGGYTGDWYIVLGDDDDTYDEYVAKYGEEHILVFDKEKWANRTDTCDNFNKRKCAVFARNVCFDIAKKLGYTYFVELDDDYTSFEYRYEENDKFKVLKVEEFDELVDIMIEFLETSENIYSVAFGQGGDFIGGKDSSLAKAKIKRKAMNSWFCKTDRYFQFMGSMNDDVNTYCHFGSQGKIFMTIRDVSLRQKETQNVKGGMTDEYNSMGTYLKSFYTVMMNPSFAKVFGMDTTNTRLHHRIDYKKAFPQIISSKYKKTT